MNKEKKADFKKFKNRLFILRYLGTAVLTVFLLVGSWTVLYGVFDSRHSLTAPLPAAADADVSVLQKKLAELGFYGGEASGAYDTPTSEAVRRYQLYLGLEGTGKADGATLAALEAEPDAGYGYDEHDIYLLARLINAEADDGTWLDMVSVGAEALRRISDPAYPETLAGVIFERGAYKCVDDGSIWAQPSERAVRAARDAMRGMLG